MRVRSRAARPELQRVIAGLSEARRRGTVLCRMIRWRPTSPALGSWDSIPIRISHLAQAAQFLGDGDVQRIDQLGERLPQTVRPFLVLPEFAHLIAGTTS